MLKKLRLKFILTNMLIVAMMLLVIFGMVYHFTKQNLQDDSLRMMQTIAANPFQLGRPGEVGEDVRLPYFLIQFTPRGDLVAASSGYFDLSDREFLLEVLTQALQTRSQTGILKEYGLRFYRNSTPDAHYLVFADITSEQATLSSLVHTCLFLGILSLFAFFIISLLLARWAVKPVDQAWQQQRQFVADASHELKTPLTVITTNAELLQDPESSDEVRSHARDSILTMARQMRGLVEGLLELARADNGTAQLHFAPLDLSGLASDALLPFEPVFFEAELTLHSRIDPGIGVQGSESHLRQVVDILLDNARKYAAPRSWVGVSLVRQGSQALLAVSTPGETLSKEDLKNIFKRFYRVDKVRSLSDSYGLGLPIAESIVTAHKGRIWAESEGGVNTFFVQFPTLQRL